MHRSLTTRSARTVLAGAAVALGAAALALPPGATAAPGELGAACVNGVTPGAAGESGNASYDSTITEGTQGKKPKKKDEPATAAGSFASRFTLAGPSCLGVDYVLTVVSADGSDLGWTTTGTSAPEAVTGTTPTAVTITWPGDGFASEFAATGATAGYFFECVDSTVRAVRSDGSEVFVSREIRPCDGTGGGTSYF